MAEFHNPSSVTSGRTQANYTYRHKQLLGTQGWTERECECGDTPEIDLDLVINQVVEILKGDGVFEDIVVDEDKIVNNVIQYLQDNDLLNQVDTDNIVSIAITTMKADTDFINSLKGPKGDKGDPGKDGKDGQDGTDGKDGEKGEKGDPGADGKDGESPSASDVADILKADTDFVDSLKGDKGDKGDPGEAGADGKDGKDGEPGPKGDPGENGQDGTDGEKGDKGDPGDPGKDADPQDVADILKADEDFIAACKGDKGDPGEDGKDGDPGEATSVKISEEDGNILEEKEDGLYATCTPVEISKEDGNATVMKEDGIYTPDLTEDIQTVDEKVESIKKYQKYLNTELEYCDLITTTSETFTVNQPIPFDVCRAVANMEYDLTDSSITLKSGKSYEINYDIYSASSSVWGMYGLYNVTDGEWLDSRMIKVNNDVTSSTAVDTSGFMVITPDHDIKVQVRLKSVSSGNTQGTYAELGEYNSHFSVIEIGRVIEIDPVNYANEEGIEDIAVGTIIPFMGNNVPKHYLACDGTEYNIDDYPYLAEFINEEFGAYNHFGGDGTTTFAVPDLRGEFLRGTGTNGHTGQGNGADVGVHQDATRHVNIGVSAAGSLMVGAKASVSLCNSGSDGSTTIAARRWTSLGSSSSDNTPQHYTSRPTNTSVLWCIKYEPTYFMQIGGEAVNIQKVIEGLDEQEYLKGQATEEFVEDVIETHTEDMKEEIRNGYQKILDEDIKYCSFVKIYPTSNGPTFSSSAADLTLNFKNIETCTNYVKQNNGFTIDEDGYVELKAGHLYNIYPTLTANASNCNLAVGIIDKSGKKIGQGNSGHPIQYVSNAINISDASFPIIYMPENDCAIALRIHSYGSHSGSIYQYGVTIFEVKQPVYTNVNVSSYADQVGKGEDTPVGQIISFMGNTAPQNYLACDGSVYSITDYPDLANFFNEQFGAINQFGGDGTTTFAVPDLRGEFLRGTGTNGHDNQGNGENVGTHQNSTVLPAFCIDLGNSTLFVPRPIPNGAQYADSLSAPWANGATREGRSWFTADNTDTHTAGSGGTTMTVRPTNTSVMYCIKAVRTFSMKIEDAKIYSEQERVIGEWIDGKVLYQRTIVYGESVQLANGRQYLDTGIDAELDTVFIDRALIYDLSQNVVLTAPYSDAAHEQSIGFMVDRNTNKIDFMVTGDWGHVDKTIITISYTKK